MYSEQDTLAGGFPHSDVRGSTIARISPRLFAACHVLLRLLAPRHPPNALLSLTITTSPNARTQYQTAQQTSDNMTTAVTTHTHKTLPPDSPVKEHTQRRSCLRPGGLLEAIHSQVARTDVVQLDAGLSGDNH